ncbi:MAG: YdcF family protein, partial [Lachnospiraceae bacterium]|nr:YdcF family protein [Lachnospiraceae bacterium]
IIGIVIICGSIFIIVECIIIKEFVKEGKKNLDAIIVLGAQVYEDSPSVVLKYRLDKAIEYLTNNKNTICIVSGGKGYNEKYPEAIIMQKYMIENGIKDDRVLIEDKSKNTEENIKNSMQNIDEDKLVGIVTNNFYIYRALQIAKKVGLKDVYGVVAKSDYITLPNNLLREFFAVIKESLKKGQKMS